jgi:hypothetical protein
MSTKAFKRMLSVALLLAAVYGLTQTIHQTALRKVVSPIASAVWGS